MRTRTNLIQVWLNDKELEKLNTFTRKSGLTRAAYVRHLLAGLQPRDLPPPDFRPMMRQLYACGNSLNQIARKAHALGVIDVQKYDEAVTDFRNAVRTINKAVLEPTQFNCTQRERSPTPQ